MRLQSFLAALSTFSAVSGHLLRRQAESELGALLSPGASIYNPGSEGFDLSNERFTLLNAPNWQFVVHVASEADVVATVQYAVANNITFLAKSGGHGLASTLARVRNAIMIDMRGLNWSTYDEANSQVTVGGGIRTGEFINATHAVGKEVTAGSCPCTGVMGVTMGGGVGRLMGRHGLIIDNLVEMRYVLANGSVITLNENTDPELWWGVRGAGQNFGIATQATFRVYDQVNNGDHYAVDMEFSMSQLQDVLSIINRQQAAPLDQNLALFLVTVPVGSTGGPVIAINFVYSGPAADSQDLLQEWLDINPVTFSDRVVQWDSLPWRVQAGLNSELCTPNKYRNSYSVAMETYDPEGTQRLFDAWEQFVEDYGADVTMNLIYETFPQQAVEAVDVDNTAYRWRQIKTLGIFQATYFDPKFSTLVDDWLIEQEKLANEVTGYDEKRVYANYGKGSYNAPEDFWGHEGQVQRLVALKQRVDPSGHFDGFRALLDYA